MRVVNGKLIIQLEWPKVATYLLFQEDYMVSNTVITDFCTVIEQESWSKPVFCI